MLELSNGTYSLSFAIYLFLGIVIRFVPDVFPQFQRQNPGGSYPIANFNLPFEVTEQNWPRVRRVGSGIFFAFLWSVWQVCSSTTAGCMTSSRGNTAKWRAGFSAPVSASF